jgi:thioester reductase-like protein
MAGLNFGYAQTKWVSEQLVHEATTRGVRARVYRPSFVTASRSGRYVRRDVLARIFPYMIQREIAPDAKNQLSCLPVDVCSNNIVALSLLDHLNEHTFHLTADRYYSIRDFCESITRQYGYRFDYMSFERLVDHLNHHSRQHDPVFPLLPFLNHNFRRIEAMAEKRYVSEAYKHARQLSAATLPEPDLDSIVGGFVTFLQQERLVPQYARSRVVRATLI